MAFLVLGANSVSGYTVKNSLRFNSGSTDYLNRTFSTPTNNKKWTWSAWIKKSKTVSTQVLFAVANEEIRYISDGGSSGLVDSLQLSTATGYYFRTNAVYRDLSAWYHIVVATDMTQATASQRVRIYVNGSEASTDGTYNSTQNADTLINSAIAHNIGRRTTGSLYFDGYQSEVYFIDGQQLTPTSFGETDTDTGIWIPKAYTGTYGTNGFYLQFKNSASLGTDSSGNGNTFTVNNLTSVDQSTDTPTNNFATWNPLYAYGNQTFTEGNLQLATGTSGGSTGTIAVNTGKWYWECKVISASGTARIAGIFQMIGTNTDLGGTGSIYYMADGQKNINGTSSSYGATLTTNDIVGVAVDVDNRSVTYYKNGTSQGAISLTSVFNVGDYITASLVQSGGSSQSVGINFGSPYYSGGSNTDGAGYGNFSYAVPSGYYSLNTRNLANFG